MTTLILRRHFAKATATATATAGTRPSNELFFDIVSERDPTQLLAKFKTNSKFYRFRCNPQIYRVAVRRLASAGDRDAIHDLISSQKQYPEIAKEGFSLRLLSLYGSVRMFDRARELLDEMPKLGCTRTIKSFNTIMAAAMASDKFEEVPALFEKLPSELSVQPNADSFDWLVAAYCRLERLDDALVALKKIFEAKLVPKLQTFNTILESLYKEQRFKDAEDVWRMMHRHEVARNVASYNAKIGGLVAAKKMKEAVAVFDGLENLGFQPDVHSFNALFKGFVEEKNVKEVNRLYYLLPKYSVHGNYVTYALIVPLLCEVGMFDMAFMLSMASVSKKRFIDLDVLQKVVDGLVKKSNFVDATALADLCKGNYDEDLIVPITE